MCETAALLYKCTSIKPELHTLKAEVVLEEGHIKMYSWIYLDLEKALFTNISSKMKKN